MPIKRNVCEWLVTCVYIAYNYTKTLYLIFDYPYKYYTFKLFEV